MQTFRAKANDLFNKRLLLYRNVYTRIIIYHSRFTHIIYSIRNKHDDGGDDGGNDGSSSDSGGNGGGGCCGTSGDGGCFACQTSHAIRNTVHDTKTVYVCVSVSVCASVLIQCMYQSIFFSSVAFAK